MKMLRIKPEPLAPPVTDPKQSQSYYDAYDAAERACRVRAYEPGADHEHVCLASTSHPGLDHTCGQPLEDGARCCWTWSDIDLPTDPEAMREAASRLLTEANEAEAPR